MINYYQQLTADQRRIMAKVLNHNAKQLIYKPVKDRQGNMKMAKRPINTQNHWYYQRRAYLTYLARKVMMNQYSPNYRDLLELWVQLKMAKPYLVAKHYQSKPILRLLTREWVIMLFVDAGNVYLHDSAKLSQLKTKYLAYTNDKYDEKQEHQLMVSLARIIHKSNVQEV